MTNPTDFGSPNINISGFDSTGLTPPLGRIDTTGHIDQTFTYTMGSHEIRFGGDYRYSRLDVFYDAERARYVHLRWHARAVCHGRSDRHLGVCPGSSLQSRHRSNALADFLSGRVATGHASIAYGDQQRIYNLHGMFFFRPGHLEGHSEADPELWLELGVPEPDHQSEESDFDLHSR